MKRAHRRQTCAGGSAARPDPLVIEIAEPATASGTSAAPPREAFITFMNPESAEGDVAVIDEHLLVATRTAVPAPGVQEVQRAAPPDDTWVRRLMGSVQLPTLRALGTASLEPLRVAIRNVTEEQNPRLWAAYHALLGTALKFRSDRARGSIRAKLLIEATRAFDVAYGVYATLHKLTNLRDYSVLHPAAVPSLSDGGCHRPFGPCVGERDGTSLIARVITGPAGENTHLLERAIACLRLVRACADVESWTWVSSTNNLACALTLLGNRNPARAGSAMLEEAARVLNEVLRAHAAGHQHDDRGSTLVNLAEALLSMAEREMPAQRVRQVECAFMASSAALGTVAPQEMLWLITFERRALE